MNVDRVVGHDSEGLAQLDGDEFIVERTADVKRAEIPLKTDAFPLFFLTFH